MRDTEASLFRSGTTVADTGAADGAQSLVASHGIWGEPQVLRSGSAEEYEPLDTLVSHRASPSDMAPGLVRLLPPLTTPQAAGVSAPPIAALSLQQGAWAEAVAAQDDLSTLAANIKRILDEEARRHGIDV